MLRPSDILQMNIPTNGPIYPACKDAKIKGIEYFPEQEEEERLAAEEAALEAAKSVNLQQLLDAEFSGPSADDMARSLEQMKRDANMSMTVDRALWLGAEEEEEEQ